MPSSDVIVTSYMQGMLIRPLEGNAWQVWPVFLRMRSPLGDMGSNQVIWVATG